jgi:uncharacterized membrane protein YfcA
VKPVEWAAAALLIILAAAGTGIGVAAAEHTSSRGLEQVTAGFMTGMGISVLITVLVEVIRRIRAR